MSDITSGKNKHMTLEDRIEIYECLNKGMTFKAIGRRIKKDQTTVSKEVKKHLTERDSGVKLTKENGVPVEQKVCP